MQYRLAPLYCRPWTLNGITPRLIESHYERNYGGELRRLNAIAASSTRSIRRPRRPARSPASSATRRQRSTRRCCTSSISPASAATDGRCPNR